MVHLCCPRATEPNSLLRMHSQGTEMATTLNLATELMCTNVIQGHSNLEEYVSSAPLVHILTELSPSAHRVRLDHQHLLREVQHARLVVLGCFLCH